MTDLKKLREIARRACYPIGESHPTREEIQAFVDTFAPEVALALLDRLEAAERALASLQWTSGIASEALAEIRRPIE